jgi:hypothetical protein
MALPTLIAESRSPRSFNDCLVNLSVFDSNGTPFSRTSVPLVQEGEAKPEHGYFCSWMPYQVGQAAKQRGSAPV